MTCVTGTAIEPVPLMELELTGPQPPELAGGHTEFGVCHFLSLSGMHPKLPHKQTVLWDGRRMLEQVDICLMFAFVYGKDKCIACITDSRLIKV